MDIQDIKLVGDAITGGGANFICLLDNNGMYVGSYGWWLEEDGADTDCWFDDGEWAPIEDTVSDGQGFYVYTVDEGLAIQSSGAVKLTDYSTKLSKGYSLVGNSSPVNLDLQDIKLVGDAITGGGANFICLLDNNGMYVGSYGWWLEEDGADTDCWFDDGEWAPIEDTIKAGQGLYMYSVDENIAISYPKAIK